MSIMSPSSSIALCLLTCQLLASNNERVVVAVNSSAALLPTFTWVDTRTLQIDFPDGDQDKTHLRPADKVGQLQVPCLYEGVLARERSAAVVVSGCRNDQVVEVVIYTTRFPAQRMFRIRQGRTEPVQIVSDDGILKSRRKRLRKRGIFAGDDYDEIEYDGSQNLPDPLPFYVFDVRLGFEENFLRRAGSELNARHMIARIFTLGKLHLKHESLGTSIRLRPQGPITEISNQHWKPGGRDGKFLKEAMKHKKNEKVPITFFCGNNNEKNNPVRGSSYIRKGCDEEKGVALVAYDDDIQMAAQTYSHETAHWMGIEHDKVVDVRDGTRCEGRGLMSNASMPEGRPEEWSSCSKERLKKWLSRPQNDCLKKDEQLMQLEDDFDCDKWRTQLGPLQSGCDRPGQMAHGKWHCTDDGVKCGPICDFGYKMLHSLGETSIRCFNETWMDNAEDFTCVCDKEFKTPYGTMECSGDTCNLSCNSGYDSSALRTLGNIQLTPITCTGNRWSEDPSTIACDYKCQEPNVHPEVGYWELQEGGCGYRLICPSGQKSSDQRQTFYQKNEHDWSIPLTSFTCVCAGPYRFNGVCLPLVITETGTIRVTGGSLPTSVKYIAIGGGAGGGDGYAGGGGSGFISSGTIELSNQILEVTIGEGGKGRANGGNTRIGDIVAPGGKKGMYNGADGWSGGGAGCPYSGSGGMAGGSAGSDGHSVKSGYCSKYKPGKGQKTTLDEIRVGKGKLEAGAGGVGLGAWGGGGGGITLEKADRWTDHKGEGYGAGARGQNGPKNGNQGLVILYA